MAALLGAACSIPMMDLLVHLSAHCKVPPSGHSLQVVDEETGKPMDFKASQTIGSLGASVVYIVSKNKKPDWSKAASKAGKAVRAFEVRRTSWSSVSEERSKSHIKYYLNSPH
jgi:hypothetical protein